MASLSYPAAGSPIRKQVQSSGGMTVAAAGLVVGIASAAALTRVITTLLYQVSPQDPLTYGAVAIVVSALSLVACGGPALRATLIDPIVTLRE
jgi:putative ABC transport system permease protein